MASGAAPAAVSVRAGRDAAKLTELFESVLEPIARSIAADGEGSEQLADHRQNAGVLVLGVLGSEPERCFAREVVAPFERPYLAHAPSGEEQDCTAASFKGIGAYGIEHYPWKVDRAGNRDVDMTGDTRLQDA